MGFVFIDGDHSTEGVRRDIGNLLGLVPKTTIVFIMHDSFNPNCRKGITSAEWSKCRHVQSVEVDFIPGKFFRNHHDTARPRTMWGGFACAILTPEPRNGPLEIKESQREVYRAVKRVSIHGLKNLVDLVRNLKSRIRSQ